MPLPRENNRLGHRPRHHDRESLTQAELIILADVHYIARLVEREPICSACALRVEHDPQDQKLVHINMKHLDPLIFGEALGTSG